MITLLVLNDLPDRHWIEIENFEFLFYQATCYVFKNIDGTWCLEYICSFCKETPQNICPTCPRGEACEGYDNS